MPFSKTALLPARYYHGGAGSIYRRFFSTNRKSICEAMSVQTITIQLHAAEGREAAVDRYDDTGYEFSSVTDQPQKCAN